MWCRNFPVPTLQRSPKSEKDKDKLITTLFDHLDAMCKRSETREAQVRKNSSNSSKPPSSDGLSNCTGEELVGRHFWHDVGCIIKLIR